MLLPFLAGCLQPASAVLPDGESAPVEATPTPLVVRYDGEDNFIFLSIEENGYAHLFALREDPSDLPLTRITSGAWNDVAPALSPDGGELAFASDRTGYWDLYVMNLRNGEVTQITDSPQYDSAPSWSPDAQWLAFETYVNDNLEVAVVSVRDRSQPVLKITEDPASDHSPSWAPDGRNVAFVSTRSGNSDVWLANLDLAGEERYTNLSNTPLAVESTPLWNRDGSQILWASSSQTVGFSGLYVWSAAEPTRSARWIGDGILGSWDANGEKIAAVTNSANQNYLTSYDLKGGLLLPPVPLSGRARGLSWGYAQLPNPFPVSFAEAAAASPTAPWAPIITPGAEAPNQRWYVVPILDVQAPFPHLHDLVDESFNALRNRIIVEAGWDVLASLENAFIPLTTELEPGLEEDWLYTGRAFSLNPLMADTGWLTTLREDIGSQTYWRVYIRALLQDGSLGEPIHNSPWNLSARYGLDPRTYEQGGEYASVPAGYWVDLTALCAAYQWERLPALPNWRTYYRGARFNEFVLSGGLDWYSAMRELYPPEALMTPTRVLPPSLTPTRTFTPTETPRPTRTPRPTYTPSLTPTPAPPTETPTLTATPPTIIP
ncbi:MAG: hypothetical protein LDL51_08480 [Chloroflexi bacterium]|nr:hypothetical protein [Chloroflexota bacterium]